MNETTNKMYAKPQFKCGICGTIHQNIKDRMNCEAACLKKQEEEEKKIAEIKKKEEYEADCKKLTQVIDEGYLLIRQHLQKYGEYKYSGTNEELKNFDITLRPSKLWNYFLF